MVLPELDAQQMATCIGWLVHGRWGGVVAGGLSVLPSLLVLVALLWVCLLSVSLQAGIADLSIGTGDPFDVSPHRGARTLYPPLHCRATAPERLCEPHVGRQAVTA